MKKFFSLIIAVFLFASIPTSTASSAVPETVMPCESSYLLSYGSTASTGSAKGTIDILFVVKGLNVNTTKIGVSKISVCRYDGTPIKTIYGSFTNGLLSSGVIGYTDTYQIDGLEAGTSYYAQVTVIAADSSGSDTRTVTTNTVKAGS